LTRPRLAGFDLSPEELKTALVGWSLLYAIETWESFGDLLWDNDTTFSEVQQLDRVVVVDSLTSQRRIVFQRIRGEIRFWLSTDRDPYNNLSESSLGVLASSTAAAALCDEFVRTGTPLASLVTPRTWHRDS
jgi:hypothetical protein